MIIEVQWIYDSKLTALKKIQTNQKERQTELRNSNKEWQCINPQIRDHSNKVLSSKDFTQSTSLLDSSKVQASRFFQINHIRHAGTIFHTFEVWLPNQFHHVERRETTFFGITHWTPNKRRTSLHKVWAYLQWINKWSTVSSSHRQRQHHLTRGKFFLTRLSIVRIPPLAAVHKKKATLLGTLTHQMLFQGNDTNGAASNEK